MERTLPRIATGYPQGLRYLFVLGAIGSFATGVPAVFFPRLVVQFSGLSAEATPAIQMAGALTISYFVAALLCLRAQNWSEVRITTIATFAAFVLTLIGAFNYVVLQGLTTPLLVLTLAIAIVMTLGMGYFVFKYWQSGEVLN